jgi:hypothetical protein
MSTWKHWGMRWMSSNLHCLWFNAPADQRRNYVRSTGACAVLLCNHFLACQSIRMIRSDHVVKIGSRNQGCLYTRVTSRRPVLLGEFPAQMTQRPLYTKSCVHRQVDTNTHTHTHTHRNPACISKRVEYYLQRLKSWREPTQGTLSALKNGQNLEKHVRWDRFHQCPWKEDILPPFCQRTTKPRLPVHHRDIQAECSAWWVPCPNDTEACGH